MTPPRQGEHRHKTRCNFHSPPRNLVVSIPSVSGSFQVRHHTDGKSHRASALGIALARFALSATLPLAAGGAERIHGRCERLEGT
jgi:hypothetical protein